MPKYSIVVPFHNEEENVTALFTPLKQVMEQVGEAFELVFVDDGSADRTCKLLEEIAAVDSRVLVIRLRRNFGRTSALAAGFDHASGEFIVAMDGDMQYHPSDIPAFLEKLEEGYDVVSGWREKQMDSFSLRRIPWLCANWVMARLSGVPIHDFGTTFKAYRRGVIQNISLYGEMHRFIPALASFDGASICEIPIRNVERVRGGSYYDIGRTFRLFFDLLHIRFLLRYMSRPLHFFGRPGLLAILVGSTITMILLGIKIEKPHLTVMHSYGSIFVIGSLLTVSGVQLVALGLLCELQVRHYHTTQQPASYTIDRLVRMVGSEAQNTVSDQRQENF